MPIHHLLAGAIRVQGLRHEQRQGVGRGIEALPMGRQVLLNPVKQGVAGQQVEKIIAVKMACMMTHSALLMGWGFMGKVHVGWRPYRPLFG